LNNHIEPKAGVGHSFGHCCRLYNLSTEHTADMLCMLAMGKQLTTHSRSNQALSFYRVQ